jgi:hypothetical protein
MDVVRCAECGLETQIDIRSDVLESFMVMDEEIKRKCKLAKNLGFKQCFYFDAAVSDAVRDSILPSGKSK